MTRCNICRHSTKHGTHSIFVEHFALHVFLKPVFQPLRERHFNADRVEGLVARVAMLAAFLLPGRQVSGTVRAIVASTEQAGIYSILS